MWIVEKPNGKYLARERYKDPETGKTKCISVTIENQTRAAKKAAQDILNQRIDEILADSVPDPHADDITLQQLLKIYIKYKEKIGHQPNTIRRDQFTIQSMIDLIGHDTMLSDLSAHLIMESLLNADIENSTRNNYLTRFRPMINYAFETDRIKDISFMRKVKSFPETSTRAKITDKYLEKDELRSLIDGMNEERWQLLTRFLALSGLRIGEAIALEDSDIHDNHIHVNKTIDINTEKRKDRTKTDTSTREVFTQPDLDKCIKEIRNFVRKDSLKHGYRSTLFFPGNDGRFLHYYAYRKYLREIAKKVINRTNCTPHILRHTHVSILAAQGLSFDAIARRVGHADSRITREIYFHVTNELKKQDDEAMKKVSIL